MDRQPHLNTVICFAFRWAVAVLMWAACANLQAQFPRALTEGMRLSNQISSALELELDVQRQVLEVALQGDACLAHWRAHQDSAEASTMPESELLKVLTRVREETTRCRNARQDNIRNLLPDSLKAKFNALDAPARPNVLHFGLHNRMDCEVCVNPKPSEE